MAQNMPKRKIKDSVFTNLFQDKKYLLCLYKVLHPEDSDVTEDDIKDVTLYGSKRVNMPKPELYVIFTGEKPETPPDTISLSKDFFDSEKIAVDAEVKVLYQEDEMTLFDDEYVLEAYAKEREDNATQREARKTAERLIKKEKCHLMILRIVFRHCHLMN